MFSVYDDVEVMCLQGVFTLVRKKGFNIDVLTKFISTVKG